MADEEMKPIDKLIDTMRAKYQDSVCAFVSLNLGWDKVEAIAADILSYDGPALKWASYAFSEEDDLHAALVDLVIKTYVNRYDREQIVQMVNLLAVGVGGDPFCSYLLRICICSGVTIDIYTLIKVWNECHPEAKAIITNFQDYPSV